MAIIRMQVAIPRFSGLPEDVVTNTFYFNTAPDPGDLAAVAHDARSQLIDFYTGLGGQGKVNQYLSPALDLDNTKVRAYDMSAPEPRVPLIDEAMNIGPNNGGTALPAEVAACLSFKTVINSGEIKARHRGRVFIGPLNLTGIETEATTKRVIVNGNLRAALGQAAARLKAFQATDVAKWAVYSQAAQASAGLVDQGWVDDALDIQRRRGEAARNRFLWG